MYIYSFMKLNLWNISNIFSYIISKCILINLHYLWQVYWLMRLSALKKKEFSEGSREFIKNIAICYSCCAKKYFCLIYWRILMIYILTYITYVYPTSKKKKRSITCQLKCSNVSLKFFYSKQSKLKVSN